MTNLRSPALLLAALVGSLGCDTASSRSSQRLGGFAVGPGGGGERPLPSRRWVLRDADNVAVNAVVEPTCGGAGPDCIVNEVGSELPITPPCVRVIRLGDAHVDLRYLLATGRPEDCTNDEANPWNIGRFADPACAGPVYGLAENGIQASHRFVRRAVHLLSDDTVYFQGGPAVFQETWYAGENCVEVEDAEPRFQWFPVPGAFSSALANPPYVLAWE
jgi:hypothetical protein